MALFRGVVMTKLEAETPTVEPGSVNGTVRVFNELYVTDAAENNGDTIEMCKLPKGARFLYGTLQSSDAQGTATIAIGIAGTVAKYRADAILVPDVVQIFGKSEGAVLTAEETIFLTIGTGDFDLTDQTIRMKIFYTLD